MNLIEIIGGSPLSWILDPKTASDKISFTIEIYIYWEVEYVILVRVQSLKKCLSGDSTVSGMVWKLSSWYCTESRVRERLRKFFNRGRDPHRSNKRRNKSCEDNLFYFICLLFKRVSFSVSYFYLHSQLVSSSVEHKRAKE